jgi:hypothetical protein
MMVLAVTAVTPRRRLTLTWFCFAVFGSTAALQQTALTQEVPWVACIVVADADTGSVHGMRDFPANGVLIGAEKGLFVAREVGGKFSVAPAGDADTGRVNDMRDWPGGGLLIGAAKGLFLAREVGGKFSVALAGDADTGSVYGTHDLPGGGVLIWAEKGWFLAGELGGKFSVAPAGDADTGSVYGMRDSPGGGVLIRAEKGLFRTVQTPLERAQVDIHDKKSWEGSPIDPSRSLLLEFTIAHECARSADKLGLNVRVVAPGDEPPGKLMEGIERITPRATVAEFAISSVFDKPGRWSFQVVATSGGVERQVGEPQT